MTTKIIGVIAMALAVLSVPLCVDALGVVMALLAIVVAAIAALLSNCRASVITVLIATIAIFGISPLPQILRQTESVGTLVETSAYNPALVNPPMLGEHTTITVEKRMGDQQAITENNQNMLMVIGGIYGLYLAAIAYVRYKRSKM